MTSVSTEYMHNRNCSEGKHEYRAGYCLNCFRINEKMSDYEKAECTKLRNKLDAKAREERAKA